MKEKEILATLKEPVLSETAKTVLEKRYLIKDENGKVIETPKELFWRVAKHIASAGMPYNDVKNFDEIKKKADDLAVKFYNMMASLDFLPNTPTLINSGRPLGLLSGCFILPIEDSMRGIYKTLMDSALIFQSGGGCGYSFSKLRPNGDLVKSTSGTASGVISFMRVFNVSTDVVKQAGVRRGAMMGSLSVHHPEILDFISCKRDLNELNNFNVSVSVTDKFMKAVKENKDYELINPRNGQIAKKIKARDVFNKIVENAWKTGEPGVVFIDTVNRFNPTPEKGEILNSNPCFTGDMKLLTTNGYMKFEDLKDKKIDIFNKDGNIAPSSVWCSGRKDTVKIRLSNKEVLKPTPDHVFMLNDGSECEARNLKGKKIKYDVICEKINTDELFVKLGFIQGDANLSRLRSKNGHKGFEINIGKKDEDVANLFGFKVDPNDRKYYVDTYYQMCIDLGFSKEVLPKRVFPASYKTWNIDQKASFLKGLFSANGCVIKGHRVAFKSTCHKLIVQLNEALSEFCIYPYITRNKSKEVKFANGSYVCKESYDLNVSKIENLIRFKKMIGFVHGYKNEDLNSLINKNIPHVTSVKKNGIEDVYDFTESETHWGIVNNVVVHNCGEYYAQPYSSCNLGSINLSNFVVDGKFDFERLKTVIRDSVRFLDNTIDVNKFPMKEIEDMTKDTRPIGLGVMGFADVLCKIGVAYDSNDGIKFAEEVMEFIQSIAYKESVNIGKEKGICPVYFRRKDNNDYRRNSNLTVLAPTGTISMIANCSGGIEPNFGLVYTKKNVLDGKEFRSLNEDFVNAIKKEGIDIKKTIDYLDKNGSIKHCDWIPKNIKDVFVTAHDISPEYHLRMQEAFQKHVSNGISKTINLPSDATKEDVEKIYIMAHEIGLKGVTVYRDGCRTNQVLNVGNDKKEEQKKEEDKQIVRTRKRPPITKGETHQVMTGCGDAYITINEDEKGICECFISVGRSGGCVASQCEAVGRLVSLATRSNVQIDKIIKQLKGIRCPSPAMAQGGSVLSCADAIGKTLEQYLKRKNKEIVQEKRSKADLGHNPSCPQCSAMMVFSEGCGHCPTCGYSKCG